MGDPSRWILTAPGWDVDKHYKERMTQGFSKADWINFDEYIAWVIAGAVQKMKDEGHTYFSYPGEPEETWPALTNRDYDIMIKGFSQWADQACAVEPWSQSYKDLQDALEIFKNRFISLWD